MMQNDQSFFRGGPFSMSWTAIFSGIFVAAGVWLLLHVLGLAIGFSQLDPGDAGTLRAFGIGAGVWAVVTNILALFCGGWVTARSAGVIGRGNAALHGIVLWGATTLASLVLIFSVLTRIGANASQLSLPTGTMSTLSESVGLTANDALAPINAELKEAGQPTITAAQLRTAMQEAVATSLRRGTLDWEVFQRSLATNTALSVQDINQILAGSQQRLMQAAEEAAQVTARTFWGLFFVLLTSLIASVGGAAVGVTRRQRELSNRVSDAARHEPGHHHPQTA